MESHLTPSEYDSQGLITQNAIGNTQLSSVGSRTGSSDSYSLEEEYDKYVMTQDEIWEDYIEMFQSKAGNYAIHDASKHHCPIVFYTKGFQKLIGMY